MKRILFVCKGNVARSQMAEAFLRKYKTDYESNSAGIQPDTPQRYVHPVPQVVDVMNEEGIDVSKAIVKTISKLDINKIDQVVIMCDKNDCPDYLLHFYNKIFWEIADPYESDISYFRKVRDQIKKLVLETF